MKKLVEVFLQLAWISLYWAPSAAISRSFDHTDAQHEEYFLSSVVYVQRWVISDGTGLSLGLVRYADSGPSKLSRFRLWPSDFAMGLSYG
jgi:hypothetical protein